VAGFEGPPGSASSGAAAGCTNTGIGLGAEPRFQPGRMAAAGNVRWACDRVDAVIDEAVSKAGIEHPQGAGL